MRPLLAIVAVCLVCPFAGTAAAQSWPWDDVLAWDKAVRAEVDACAVKSNATGHVAVWFAVDAQRDKTVVTDVLPSLRDVGPNPCWRKLVESFRPAQPVKAYARMSCTIFRPKKNAPATETDHASCANGLERADTVPDDLVAWLVGTQLAPALPSLWKCVEQHGKHLPQLELVLERAYSPSMTVRYLREQPSSLRTGEEPSSRPTGTCYAERILAERARLVWPPTLPKVEAPPLDVFFPTAMFGPHAPSVYVRRRAGNSR